MRIFSCQAPKTPRRNQSLKLGHKSKNVPYKNISKLGDFDVCTYLLTQTSEIQI